MNNIIIYIALFLLYLNFVSCKSTNDQSLNRENKNVKYSIINENLLTKNFNYLKQNEVDFFPNNQVEFVPTSIFEGSLENPEIIKAEDLFKEHKIKVKITHYQAFMDSYFINSDCYLYGMSKRVKTSTNDTIRITYDFKEMKCSNGFKRIIFANAIDEIDNTHGLKFFPDKKYTKFERNVNQRIFALIID